MKKHIIIFALMLSHTFLMAQEKPKVKFAYDVDFEMNFDNREFYRSNFSTSMTVFGARLTPAVGLSVTERNGAAHRLMLGIDVMKDFGASPISELVAGGKTDETLIRQNNLGLLRELTLFYSYNKNISRTQMEIYAGIFPRRAMEGKYSQAFFSDSLAFYDNNLEGLLLKFTRPKSYYEVGCDWMGQYGKNRRERFMVFTAGEGEVLPFMKLGYAAYMLHYANSQVAKGLVDNLLLNPYIRFDIGRYAGMQELSLRLGWLQAIQRDRVHVGAFIFPYGGEFDQHIRNWDVGIHNKVYWGHDMMPYYNGVDNAGVKYGTSLYFGDPFYRVHDDGRSGAGFYDRLEVYYEPKLGDFIRLRLAALFHFHGTRYSGCQQVISLRFNLQELLDRTDAPRRSARRSLKVEM